MLRFAGFGAVRRLQTGAACEEGKGRREDVPEEPKDEPKLVRHVEISVSRSRTDRTTLPREETAASIRAVQLAAAPHIEALRRFRRKSLEAARTRFTGG